MDTESQYSIFWNEVGKKYHPEYEEFGKIIKGQTLRQIYDRYFQGMEHEQAEITEGLNRFETEMRYEYVPGVAEFMQSLRAHGVKIAIVTSSNEKKWPMCMRHILNLKDMVDRILTAEMFQKSKPDPDCFLAWSKSFCKLSPANCVVFEDSFHGIQAGNAAGMPVVGLSTTNPAEAIQISATGDSRFHLFYV